MIPLQLLNTDRYPIAEAFDKVWISLSQSGRVFPCGFWHMHFLFLVRLAIIDVSCDVEERHFVVLQYSSTISSRTNLPLQHIKQSGSGLHFSSAEIRKNKKNFLLNHLAWLYSMRRCKDGGSLLAVAEF